MARQSLSLKKPMFTFGVMVARKKTFVVFVLLAINLAKENLLKLWINNGTR
jgi:hypothetical protein